jgi:hypothetical protein
VSIRPDADHKSRRRNAVADCGAGQRQATARARSEAPECVCGQAQNPTHERPKGAVPLPEFAPVGEADVANRAERGRSVRLRAHAMRL